MKIVADPNIPFVREAFGLVGEIQVVPGRQMNSSAVRDADILLVRSVTPVNADLLDGSKVKFVATATIGTDHVDANYLAQHGIGFASAAGSNANSVAEYVVAAMLELGHRKRFHVRDKTLGIIGVGHIGKILVRYAEALGMRVLQNDPPRQRAEKLPHFVPLDRILAESDFITIHVPLIRSGPDRTYHLFDEQMLAALKRQPTLINSARGAAVDNQALLKSIRNQQVGGTVLDVWENEPTISHDLLAAVDISTPHIAGYSFDGKVNGTRMIYRAVCEFMGESPVWDPVPLMADPPIPYVDIDATGREWEDILHDVVKRVYDIAMDDAALRARTREFDRLRAEYLVRREFFNTDLVVRGAGPDLRAAFAALGFGVKGNSSSRKEHP